ncbi:MAG: hypothetical protein HY717_01720 [Planctomycetes bacterium]|nr:hypothetical protein [Planctomycetota bacterium]
MFAGQMSFDITPTCRLDGDFLAYARQEPPDFNGDGDTDDWIIEVYDARDRETTRLRLSLEEYFSFLLRAGVLAFSVSEEAQGGQDLNGDGDAEDCVLHLADLRKMARPSFHRGDPNSSNTIDISDGLAVFGFLFLGDPPALSCKESADANNDGTIDVSDGIYLLEWLFIDGPEPATPGPTKAPCGLDPDPSGSPGDLGCELYPACR